MPIAKHQSEPSDSEYCKWKAFTTSERPAMLRFAFAQLRDDLDAQMVVSQTEIELFQKRSAASCMQFGKPLPPVDWDNPRPLAYRILQMRVRDVLRERRRKCAFEQYSLDHRDPGSDPIAEESPVDERSSEYQFDKQLFDQLPPQDQFVLYLKYWARLQVDEIAATVQPEQYGGPLPTVPVERERERVRRAAQGSRLVKTATERLQALYVRHELLIDFPTLPRQIVNLLSLGLAPEQITTRLSRDGNHLTEDACQIAERDFTSIMQSRLDNGEDPIVQRYRDGLPNICFSMIAKLLAEISKARGEDGAQ